MSGWFCGVYGCPGEHATRHASCRPDPRLYIPIPDHDATAQRAILLKYLLMKVDIADWHGVSDAANDLRELEAAHPELRK